MAWKESEAALEELMRCEHPRLVGGIDIPQKVDRWWARNGVPIVAETLNRADLFALAEKTRTAEHPDWVDLLWNVLAWGVAGELRNAPTIVRSAASEGDRNRLNVLLSDVAGMSYSGNFAGAYAAIHKKVPRLGPAFFTKFLYFTGDRSSGPPRGLILDLRVTAAAFALTGRDFYNEKPAVYERFCGLANDCAQRTHCTPDEVEFRLYKLGVLIQNARWRWLHAETSLYREGARDVSFNDIVERLAAR